MTANTDVSSAIVRTLIPARMDRLPWTRFHTRLVMSLGTAWILDGLEITLASSVAGVLTASDTLRLSSAASWNCCSASPPSAKNWNKSPAR